MARQKLDPAAPSLADMFTAGIGQAPEVPKPSKSAPPPIAPGVHLAGVMNGEAEAARAKGFGINRPEVQATPPAEADNLHAQMDANRAGRNDGKKRHAAKVAAKKGDNTRPARAQKLRDARRQKSIAAQRERAKTNPLLKVGGPAAGQERALHDGVKLMARVLVKTGLLSDQQIADQCGVERNTLHQWISRGQWERPSKVAAPESRGENVPRRTTAPKPEPAEDVPESAKVAGHHFELKIAKESVSDARQQARLEYVLGMDEAKRASELWSAEAGEDEGRLSVPQVVDFQGFDDLDCQDGSLLITYDDMMMGCEAALEDAQGLQGGTVEDKKILSPAGAPSHDVTLPPIVGAVIAANEGAERVKWTRRREEWRERTHKVMDRALGAAETLPDVLLLDKDTTMALKHVQEMARRNLDLEGDSKVTGGGNLLVSILAAPVGVAVQIEHRQG
jgi:transposase